VPLDFTPRKIPDLEVTVRVYPHQPTVVMWFFPDLVKEIQKIIEPEFNTAIVEVPCLPASWVSALAFLMMVGTIGRRPALDAALTVLDGRGPGLAEVAATRSGQAAPQMPTLHVYFPSAVTTAQVDSTTFLDGA
jgi:hypothetical protein